MTLKKLQSFSMFGAGIAEASSAPALELAGHPAHMFVMCRGPGVLMQRLGERGVHTLAGREASQ